MRGFMSKQILTYTLCVFFAGTSFQVLAHRVNVFAWQEGDNISVEGKFAGGGPAKNSEVLVEGPSGKVIVQGKTDQKGAWTFVLPKETQEKKLKIVLKAGEGHQATWDLELETDGTKLPEKPMANKPEITQSVTSQDLSVDQRIASAVRAERARLEKEVIGPLRKQVAELQEPKVGWREIFGGIGWIIGLFGIGAYFKARRERLEK